jgi:hypothetical protein
MDGSSDPGDREGLRRGSLPKLKRRPPPVRRTVLVLVVVLLLVMASVLLPASWWPVLGAITAAALVPWILLALCPIFAD